MCKKVSNERNKQHRVFSGEKKKTEKDNFCRSLQGYKKLVMKVKDKENKSDSKGLFKFLKKKKAKKR